MFMMMMMTMMKIKDCNNKEVRMIFDHDAVNNNIEWKWYQMIMMLMVITHSNL